MLRELNLLPKVLSRKEMTMKMISLKRVRLLKNTKPREIRNRSRRKPRKKSM